MRKRVAFSSVVLEKCASALAEADGGARGPQTAAAEPWLWERSPDGLRTYAALAAVLALGSVPALRSQQLVDLPYFISLAVITIYVGEHERTINVLQHVLLLTCTACDGFEPIHGGQRIGTCCRLTIPACVGSHRGLGRKDRQSISLREVSC